ncbi:Rieske 2Fe-2S domain-containing protein [Mesorhizobium sp. CO1-1-8]|uniref:Rieske (2Fe-2S) protein n=1 Tax=Mesorhizobium sp. CO1-1-8 TaxID=2876631 RepID=UPI001CD10B14|nr:Rieske 2Fe-2S domain-containing protein [Mesorhizobium sp. CO1-1-8]
MEDRRNAEIRPAAEELPGGDDGPNWVAVAGVDEIPEGGICPIELEGFELLLIRNQGTVLAVQRLCPHDFADLVKGEVRDCRLYCSRHSASFSLVDGSVGGGWLVRDLKIYHARQVHEQIWIDAADVRANPPTQRRRRA